jgi:streptomycin 6-kinase
VVDEVAPLIRALHLAPPPLGFPPLAERVAFIFDHLGLSGRDEAVALASEPVAPVLLHGDLHPANVLDTDRGLIAIDPRACLGDPAFDVIDWVLRSEHDVAAWAAATRCDPERLARWCAFFRPLLRPAAPSAGA